ncbi:ubiquitin carboxyl-terminal hydrolase 43 isoform 3-T3 [Guaruba guarouba]
MSAAAARSGVRRRRGGGGSPAGRRRRGLRSLGSLAGRLLRTWARLAGGRGPRRAAPEDDEGGFGGGGHGGERRRPGGAAPGGGGERPPGAQGLRNLGNTCFMNAVVQCLSNTAPLAELLALGRYRARGARAEVTHRLAALVRALWTRDYTPQLSAEFKNIVSKHSAQFRGNSQHDALEFLLWLLDRMHEDLGSASLAPQTRVSEEPGEDGNDADSSSPAAQHPHGQSFVQSHFQAQYRSSLTCPHCLKQSNTFDPFLCISLPIPLRQTRALNVTLVLQRERRRFVRVGLAVPLSGTVAELREMVAREGRIPPEQVLLAEVSPRGLVRSLRDAEPLRAAGHAAPLYAFQPPPARRTGCSLPGSPGAPQPQAQPRAPPAACSSDCLHRRAGGRVLLLLCNTAGTGPQRARFGPPLLLREERGVSWEQLQQSILAQLRALLRGEVQAQGTGALFRIRLAEGSAPCTYLSPQDPRPLCHPAIDRALQLSGAGGPPHVNLTVEWDVSTKERLFGNLQEEVVQDAESVQLQQQAHGQQHSCTLDECFQLYTKEEQLAPDDAWRCPHCKVPQQGTVKLSLWTLPDILIIHLKRFHQVAERRHKLTTLPTAAMPWMGSGTATTTAGWRGCQRPRWLRGQALCAGRAAPQPQRAALRRRWPLPRMRGAGPGGARGVPGVGAPAPLHAALAAPAWLRGHRAGTARHPPSPPPAPVRARAAASGQRRSRRVPACAPPREPEQEGHGGAAGRGGRGCPPRAALPRPGSLGALAELGQPAPAPPRGPAALGLAGQGHGRAAPARLRPPCAHAAAGTAAHRLPAAPGRARVQLLSHGQRASPCGSCPGGLPSGGCLNTRASEPEDPKRGSC